MTSVSKTYRFWWHALDRSGWLIQNVEASSVQDAFAQLKDFFEGTLRVYLDQVVVNHYFVEIAARPEEITPHSLTDFKTGFTVELNGMLYGPGASYPAVTAEEMYG